MNKVFYYVVFAFLPPLLLQGCAGFFASQGASRNQIVSSVQADEIEQSAVQIIPVTPAIARQVANASRSMNFPTVASMDAPENLVGPGDALEVIVWEAAPAILFRNSSSSSFLGTVTPTGTSTTALPAQVVSKQGEIFFPFVGKIEVGGKTPSQIANLIVVLLQGKANQPQVIVRVASNISSTVTVVGEVGLSTRMPLTPKGERILDAIAAAGGVKQPVNKTTIQITRNGRMQSLPLETIIRDPKQNIVLQPGDVVTVYFQPLSFISLGASGKNEEITFEAQGISLSQALGRIGGLNDGRADSMGVFIFRYEDLNSPVVKPNSLVTEDNTVPVIYQFNMNEPTTFFLAQNFPIKNKDIVYVSVASNVELMKFLAIVTSVLAPAVSVNNNLITGN
jgi:polysaccharide export outer membrane protein